MVIDTPLGSPASVWTALRCSQCRCKMLGVAGVHRIAVRCRRCNVWWLFDSEFPAPKRLEGPPT